MNDEKLQTTVRHAYANSPAFRERLDGAGVKPEEIKSIADLTRVPVFTKDEAIARQQADPPFGGMLAAPLSAVSHFFFSPGPLYEPGPTDAPVSGSTTWMSGSGSRRMAMPSPVLTASTPNSAVA